MQRCVRLFTLACLWMAAAGVGPRLQAAQTARLVLAPAPAGLLAETRDRPTVAPGPDQAAVVGRLSPQGFAIQAVEHLSLQGPDGAPIPFLVERGSLSGEWEIESLRIAFLLPADRAQPGTACRVVWGPDVTGRGQTVDAFRVDPEAVDRVLTFRVEAGPPAGEAESVATIEVRADSYADYYGLWYLLPIGTVFVLLTVRKIRARDRTA